ncbi:MAG: PAS domain S-box protein [Oryzomonas sp.]|uniref:hybrid sensor histidine kinase/response regulator n=1 Tax=Oryzomonas sp. TaxID=2855186 RepID=UPI0028413FD5|nr:PAS domain S-box protein [Oryzomonas sp.]MDR3581143.1 PAS domain S-box protein [Oryzomonas sp.]
MDAGHIMTSSYMEHGFCLNWERPLVFLHVGSDIVTGIAYYSIPLAMLYFAYRRRDVPFRMIFIMFALFILACGTTHFFAAYTIFRPEYWAEGYVKAFTAAVSTLSAVMFIPRIPEAIALPNVIGAMEEVRELNSRLAAKNAELQRANFSIESMHDAMYWVAADSRILRVNEAACKMLGYTPGEMMGLTITDLNPQMAPELWAMHWRELKARGALTLEAQQRAKNGFLLDVEVTANYLTYQGEEFNCAIVRDIGERKRQEDAIRTSEREFRVLAEAMPQIVWINLPDGSNIYFSQQWTEYTGQPLEESSGHGWHRHVHPDDRQTTWGAWNDATKTGAVYTVECRLQRADGVYRWWLIRGVPVNDEQGAILKWFGTCTDIHDIKTAEEEKLALGYQLHQVQKMESIGSLAGGVAHDFNNKLSVILGHADMALVQSDSALVRDSLLEIRKAAESSADLTRQLLTFARKQIIAPKVLDLNATVASMLKMLHRLIGEDIRLSWQPGGDLWRIKADPSQIDQILANLCINAKDAGGDRITIETGNSAIDEAYCVQHPEALTGDYVRLTVSDNGHGMDHATQERIFEPFFTTKDAGKGTGLGLSTVFGIVKQNNGVINVYSEPGLGTTFTIYLPRHDGELAPQQAEKTWEAVPGGPETILLVEDELSILDMIATFLARQGYSVLRAGTTAEAIRLAGQHGGVIGLLITDVIMPGMNGKELAAYLRPLQPLLRSLFMSGYTADVIAAHGVLDPGMHFIQKPFTFPDLAVKIRQVLDNT